MKRNKFISIFTIFFLILFYKVGYSQSDNCVTASPITLDAQGNACVNGTTLNATSENICWNGTWVGTSCNGGCNNGMVNEVWYTFVTNGPSNTFSITPGTMQDAVIAVYTGGCNGVLETCSSTSGSNILNVNWGIPAGTQVWVAIASNSGIEGTFQFCVTSTSPPPTGGNLCSTAIPLCDKNATTQVDMSTITSSGDWPDCFGAAMNSDVWFTFTVTQTGTLEFQATPTGNGANTVELDWAIYDITAIGGCPNATLGLSPPDDPTLDCNYNYAGGTGASAGMTNPAGGEFNSPITVTAGNTYAIVVDYYTGGGAGTLDFQFLPGMTALIAPVDSFTVSPSSPVCGSSLTVNITDYSFGGTETWDFGDGNTYAGSNPPAHTYTTPGTYAITSTITGANGCTDIYTEYVQLYGPLSTTVNTVLESCVGACDGSISLSTTGGSGQYSYSWTPSGQTTPTISNLCAGNYTATITDAICGTLNQTVNLPSGPSCCFMDSLLITINPCDLNTNDYTVDVYVSFTGAPTTGFLIIEDSLSGIQDTIYPPFISDQTYTLTGINSTGNNSAIYAYFTADPSCGLNITYTAPASCACPADAGSSTANIFGNGVNNYILCDGDTFIALSNNDTTNAIGIPPGATPGITYAIYVCPPTPGLDPANDPCYTGYVTGTISYMTDINQNGGLYTALNNLGFTINNQTIYYVPLTLIDTANLLYNPNCFDLGPPLSVTYLNPIQTSQVIDCINGTVTVTVTGGYPEIFSNGSYTIQNLQPSTATLNVSTLNNSGDNFVIQNLQPGDSYSVDIIDNNGCPITISGGPFPGAEITDTTYTNVTCFGANNGSITITANGAVQYSVDNGATWQASNSFTGLAPGTYTCIADDGTGCADTVIVSITEPLALSIPKTLTNVSCYGYCNGSIVVAPQGGVQPYNYLWSNGASSPSINNLCAGSYTLTITDANGCTLDSTFSITQPQNFSFTTNSVNANCGLADGSASVNNFSGGTPPYTYSWSNGGSGNTQTNLSAGTYTVTVVDNVGCDTVITISVGNNPGFSASIASYVDASCNGLCDGSVTAQGSDPMATYAYQWSNGQIVAQANNLCAGSYYCVVTDAATGCIDTAFATISEPAPVSISISPDTTICVGSSATISSSATGGTPPYTYNWSNGATSSSQIVSPTGNVTYTVTATDANGCVSSPASVLVSLFPVLSITTSPDQFICYGETTTISASVSGGNGGPYSYLWSNGNTNASQNVSPNTTTTYFVTATDNCSTPVTDSVLVTVYALPVPDFSADILKGCEPLTVTFYNTSNNTNNPLWNFGDGTSGAGDTIVHVYQNSGIYDVQLIVSSNQGGCTDSLTKNNYITVYDNPIADFIWDPENPDALNPTIDFIDQSYNNIVQWLWDINGMDTMYIQNPTYTFPSDSGTYLITLYVRDNHGCIDSIAKLLHVEGAFTIYIPNAFTPLDTKHLNDYFRPVGIGISDEDYEFDIFDRWGNLIYQSFSFSNDLGWDGTYKGNMVQLDVYVWKLQFKDINGKNHVLHGHVTIVK
jgi:gliding motility-associated-like protein